MGSNVSEQILGIHATATLGDAASTDQHGPSAANAVLQRVEVNDRPAHLVVLSRQAGPVAVYRHPAKCDVHSA